MGQILHGSAKTTHVVRAAIQRSKASIKELAERYDLNPKTVTKWDDVADWFELDVNSPICWLNPPGIRKLVGWVIGVRQGS
jgi:hypothetical protein